MISFKKAKSSSTIFNRPLYQKSYPTPLSDKIYYEPPIESQVTWIDRDRPIRIVVKKILDASIKETTVWSTWWLPFSAYFTWTGLLLRKLIW